MVGIFRLGSFVGFKLNDEVDDSFLICHCLGIGWSDSTSFRGIRSNYISIEIENMALSLTQFLVVAQLAHVDECG